MNNKIHIIGACADEIDSASAESVQSLLNCKYKMISSLSTMMVLFEQVSPGEETNTVDTGGSSYAESVDILYIPIQQWILHGSGLGIVTDKLNVKVKRGCKQQFLTDL